MEVIASIDQGTTSSRCILFNKGGQIVSSAQMEHEQIYPHPGWCEHDPMVLYNNVSQVVKEALENASLSLSNVKAVGITNQRETSVIWDKVTGKPLYNAIVWHDARTSKIVSRWKDQEEVIRSKTGLPAATYFCASKIVWMMENVPEVAAKIESGDALFGTIDSFLIWKLTGEQVHVTDVTNASRTLLMNLDTLDWDDELLKMTKIPKSILPKIVSSSEVYGHGHQDECIAGVPIAGNLGDQQAALFGQVCFEKGEAKNTYGTGCFLMMNTGTEKISTTSGMLTTVAYKLGNEPVTFALEGSVAIAGALIQWLRDQLQIIKSAEESETLARAVDDNGGVYLVPAFGGLFAPYWRDDARGVITGLTSYCSRNHVARAALEAVAYQAVDLVRAMEKDMNAPLANLKVDGGMVVNEFLMQFQADILDTTVVRPVVSETTALGAAYAAGLAVGYWTDLSDLKKNWAESKSWTSEMNEAKRKKYLKKWKKAVDRTLSWVDEDDDE